MNVIEQARIYNQGVEEGKRQAAQKPWVGLTDNEIALINADYPNPQGFARAIKAKLREKNGGAA
jgi:D-serine dehydratase